jgi:hypothetical protein
MMNLSWDSSDILSMPSSAIIEKTSGKYFGHLLKFRCFGVEKGDGLILWNRVLKFKRQAAFFRVWAANA